MKFLIVSFLLLFSTSLFAQLTQADSVRGNYGSSRDWWDLTHYDLSVQFDIENKSIQGSNVFSFKNTNLALELNKERQFQIDLQSPMILDSVFYIGDKGENFQIQVTDIVRKGNGYFIELPHEWTEKSAVLQLKVVFHGVPKEAVNPPWDGGFIWSKDQRGKPWVTVACQGIGASIWFPCKDSQVDKPDSVKMTYTIPSNLVCVSNGRLTEKKLGNDKKTSYTWEVKNPINSYCMIPYIGDYNKLESKYQGLKGQLDLEYWVLKGNEVQAKSHFNKNVPQTLEAFEHWFGPYPFYEDGYKIVESPHLGMEHQSAIAYGNGFKNGYKETDLSGTGIGLNWDFIIVHETAHEWFGNSITSKDIADMWIHEAFATYAEVLFVEYWYGKEKATDYCIGIRKNIKNDIPIIGTYGVHKEGSTDMYYKGANMLHTIRQLAGNDAHFRNYLIDLNRKNYHKVTTSVEVENHMENYLNLKLKNIFDQYLRKSAVPILELVYNRYDFLYRWKNTDPTFKMEVILDRERYRCSSVWNSITYSYTRVPIIDRGMYIELDLNISYGFVSRINSDELKAETLVTKKTKSKLLTK